MINSLIVTGGGGGGDGGKTVKKVCMRWSQVLFKVIIHHIPIRDARKLYNCANVVFVFDC